MSKPDDGLGRLPFLMNSPLDLTRRRFFGDVSTGLMGVGLTQLLGSEYVSAAGDPTVKWTAGSGRPHFPAKAKRVRY